MLFVIGIASLTIQEYTMRLSGINQGDPNNIEVELSSFAVFCE